MVYLIIYHVVLLAGLIVPIHWVLLLWPTDFGILFNFAAPSGRTKSFKWLISCVQCLSSSLWIVLVSTPWVLRFLYSSWHCWLLVSRELSIVTQIILLPSLCAIVCVVYLILVFEVFVFNASKSALVEIINILIIGWWVRCLWLEKWIVNFQSFLHWNVLMHIVNELIVQMWRLIQLTSWVKHLVSYWHLVKEVGQFFFLLFSLFLYPEMLGLGDGWMKLVSSKVIRFFRSRTKFLYDLYILVWLRLKHFIVLYRCSVLVAMIHGLPFLSHLLLSGLRSPLFVWPILNKWAVLVLSKRRTQ